jgi:hypothetical protein
MSVITSQDFGVLRIDSFGSGSGAQSLGPTITSIADLTDVQINEPLLDGQILKYIAATGKWTNVDPQLLTNDFVEGYVDQSGTSYTTVFIIPHGFGSQPEHVIVDPQTPEADEDFSIAVDSVNITLTYEFPPPQGTNNLRFYYRVS